MSLTVTCVHQGYELYGSDRSFVESVATLRQGFPDAEIVVVLPQSGTIVPALEPYATRIEFEPLWVLRRRDLPRLATLGLARLPAALSRAAARFRRSDLVYINTSVIVDYTLAGRFFPGRALLHVHELPDGAVRHALRALLRLGRPDLIFNSKATRESFLPVPRRSATHLLYNGIAGPTEPAPCTYAGQRPLRLLLLGRISRIKGQDVLVSALAALPPELRHRVEVRIVGGAFGGDAPVREIEARIQALGLGEIVGVLPFASDPSEHFRWADVVTVPSCLPESLGRVAIEAQAFGRPVLASRIGGLPEIVQEGVNGWLVPPGDAGALAASLEAIIRNPAAWSGFAARARQHYETTFDAATVADAFTTIVQRTLAKAGARKSQRAGRHLAGTPA